MARVVRWARAETAPTTDHRNQIIGWLVVVVVFLLVVIVGLLARSIGLADDVRQACGATGAAAKLDLSSFVPLCRRFIP